MEIKDFSTLQHQLIQARNEVKNLRENIHRLRADHKKDVQKLRDLLVPLDQDQLCGNDPKKLTCICQDEKLFNKSSSTFFSKWKPIGYMKSMYHTKNGTPRQGSLIPQSRGSINILESLFNNPHHSLQGLQHFSHVWIMFVFHANQQGQEAQGMPKAKVAPPRLNGAKVGVFASRSPHRPNNIGLTLAKIESVQGNTLYISGIDILDGTPIVDIKPFIPEYDVPDTIHRTSPMERVGKEEYSEQEGRVTEHEDGAVKHVECESYACHEKQEIDICECGKEFSCDCSHDPEPNNDSLNNVEKEGILRANCEGSKVVSKLECVENESERTEYDDNCVENRSYNKAKQSVGVIYPSTESQEMKENEKDRLPKKAVGVAKWVRKPPIDGLQVEFHPRSEQQIQCFSKNARKDIFRLDYVQDSSDLKLAIENILCEDPRSTYRRNKCQDQLYYFIVDSAHVTAWFTGNIAEVLQVRPVALLGAEEMET